MSDVALEPPRRGGNRTDPQQQGQQQIDPIKLRDVWKKRIQQAKQARRPREEQWHISEAFAAGRQWFEWSPEKRRMVFPQKLEQQLKDGVELYTADKLQQYISTALAGLLEGGDFRPQIHFTREDVPSEEFAKACNDALAYAWDAELQANERFEQLALILIVYGTGALRVRYDPTAGPVMIPQVPHLNGKPLLDPAEAQQAVIASMEGSGPQVEVKDVRGQTVLDVLSPWNLLLPPGVVREWLFPWEIVMQPRLLSAVVAEYPRADGMAAQGLNSIDALGLRELGEYGSGDGGHTDSAYGKLEDNVLMYSCYERPCPDYPDGQVAILAGENCELLDVRQELPYLAPCGGPHRSGITYFHYWRNVNRAQSRGMVETAVGPQRAHNRRRTQAGEIADRSMPYMLAPEGAFPNGKPPSGKPMEIVTYMAGTTAPIPVQPPGVPAWMIAEIQQINEDYQSATGIRDVTLGENPTGVNTYSGLVLLHENDDRKLRPIREHMQRRACPIAEDVLYDASRYWPPDKMYMIAGEDDVLAAATFNAQQLPPAYIARPAQGGAPPRTQAAEIAKIGELFQVAGAVGMPPDMLLNWYEESLNGGKATALPELPTSAQMQLARWENQQMLEMVDHGGQELGQAVMQFGQLLARAAQQMPPGGAEMTPFAMLTQMGMTVPTVPVEDYDEHQLHVPVHRKEQIEARMAGFSDPTKQLLAMVIGLHIDWHIAEEQLLAMKEAEAMAAQQAAAVEAGAVDAETQAVAEAERSEESSQAEHERQLERDKQKPSPRS